MSRITPEPPPIPNTFPRVWDLAIKDMKDRQDFGHEKYGTHLQPHNGRNALNDAYQEVLDLVVYLRQELFEKEMNDYIPLQFSLAVCSTAGVDFKVQESEDSFDKLVCYIPSFQVKFSIPKDKFILPLWFISDGYASETNEGTSRQLLELAIKALTGQVNG